MWDIILVFTLVLASVTIAFIMARVGKPNEAVLKLDTAFTKQLAESIAKAVKEALSDIHISTGASLRTGSSDKNLVQMDESIIPASLDVIDIEGKNLDNMAKEEVDKDKGLAESKSKLSSLLKKKKEK